MLPAYLQAEFDNLSSFKKDQFMQLVQWSNIGQPGTVVVSDASYENILRQVQRMSDPVIESVEDLQESTKEG